MYFLVFNPFYLTRHNEKTGVGRKKRKKSHSFFKSVTTQKTSILKTWKKLFPSSGWISSHRASTTVADWKICLPIIKANKTEQNTAKENT